MSPSIHSENSFNEQNQISKNKNSNRIFDEPDYIPSSYKVTKFDIVWLIFSIGSHILDVAFDIYVATNYYFKCHAQNFLWTVVFIVVPSLVTTLVSMRWYIVDHKSNPGKKSPLKKLVFRCLALILQLAPTLRYAESLNYAIKSRKYRKENDKTMERHYCYLMLKEDSDAALLRVIECFLESAPQLVLQLSILMYTKPSESSWHEFVTCLSVLTSFVSLAWALASYQRSLRYPQENKDNISYKGMIFQFLWHLMIIVSRVVSLSCLASKFPYWIGGGCAFHILFWYVYLLIKGPKGECAGSIVWHNALCTLLATIYIFTGIQVRDGHTRWFYSLLYTTYAAENIAIVATWSYFIASGVPLYLLCLVPIASLGCFVFGVCLMILYYLFFHPRKWHNNVAV